MCTLFSLGVLVRQGRGLSDGRFSDDSSKCKRVKLKKNPYFQY